MAGELFNNSGDDERGDKMQGVVRFIKNFAVSFVLYENECALEVEVSAFSNVNVTSVFELAAALIEKWKVKPKMIAFADALNQQRKREREIW